MIIQRRGKSKDARIPGFDILENTIFLYDKKQEILYNNPR